MYTAGEFIQRILFLKVKRNIKGNIQFIFPDESNIKKELKSELTDILNKLCHKKFELPKEKEITFLNELGKRLVILDYWLIHFWCNKLRENRTYILCKSMDIKIPEEEIVWLQNEVEKTYS